MTQPTAANRGLPPLTVILATTYVAVYSAGLFIWYYSHNVPYADEWVYVPQLVGDQPVTPRFLWEQHNEHRYPLARLAYVSLCQATQTLWIGSYVTVAGMALLALAMCRVAARLRGHASWADAFFPILLLHWGHYENYLMPWQIVFTFATALVGSVFLLLLRFRRSGVVHLMLLANILLLMPLNGALGLPYALPLTLWLGVLAIGRWRSAAPGGTRQGGILLVQCLAVVGLVAVYFVGYESSASLSPEETPLRDTLRTAAQFLTNALGPAAGGEEFQLWPFSAVVVIGLGLASTGLLLNAARDPQERSRALGILLFQGAVVVLAVGLGRGRAEYGGFVSRYVPLAVPGLYVSYFVWLLYGPPRLRPWVQAGLCLIVAATAGLNVKESLAFAEMRKQTDRAFLTDLRAGEPYYVLARRYTRPYTEVFDQESFVYYLSLLRNGPYDPYHLLTDDPSFRNLQTAHSLVKTAGMKRQGKTWRILETPAYLEYAVPRAQKVAGIQVVLRYGDREEEPISFRVAWKREHQPDFEDGSARDQWEARQLNAAEAEHSVTVWVAEEIDRFRIYPDVRPGQVAVLSVSLLVPNGSPSARRQGAVVE